MADGSGENTPSKSKLTAPWQPGQSGNPAGRPKGMRNRFAERFVTDFLKDWEEHGIATIRAVREDKPDVYLRTAAAVLPKQYDVNFDDVDTLTAEDIDRRLVELEARAAALADGKGGAADGHGVTGKPDSVH